jgi:UDP-glucose 4-epimerase
MDLKERSVLVSGGAGFIGSHLCESIARIRLRRLVVIDNLFLGKVSNLDEARALYPGLKFYKESITDYKKTKEIIIRNNVDVVFNLAVVPLPASLVKPKMTFEENVSGTLNLCELARQKYFKTLIHCSSSEAYGCAIYVPMDEKHPIKPTTVYAASKAAADMLCLSYAQTHGIDCSIIRPFNNYGPRQNASTYAGIIPIVINRIIDRKPIIIFGDGKQTRDFIFVRDTAKAFMDIYNSKDTRNKIVNIGSGREISVINLVKLILRLMNAKNVRIKYTKARPGDVRRHCADVDMARELINFSPQTSFEAGLRETVQWYLKRSVQK